MISNRSFPATRLDSRPVSLFPGTPLHFRTFGAEAEAEEDEADHTSVASRSAILAALAKKAAASPYLVAVAGRSSTGKMFKIGGDMVIGRARECGVRLNEEGVSRRHARLRICQDGRVSIADLGSTNGTFVNGIQILDCVLNEGDQIQIGTLAIMKFSYRDALDEQVQRNLYESATRDGLTGAHNKSAFLDALEMEIAHAHRQKKNLAIVMFDIDHFKRINDENGHLTGDYVLRKLGTVVRERIREGDLFARYGGEEFVLLLKEADPGVAFLTAERLRVLIERTQFAYSNANLQVTVSLGIASFDAEKPLSSLELVSQCDQYLYRAKRNGRNRTDAFSVSGAV